MKLEKKNKKFDRIKKELDKALKDVNNVLLTQQELWAYVDAQLPLDMKIAMGTFIKWLKNPEDIPGIGDEDRAEMARLLLLAQANWKRELTRMSLDKDNKAAYKQHWLLERKFKDLNPKATPALGSGNVTINILNAAGEENNNIMGAIEDAIEVPFEQVDKKK